VCTSRVAIANTFVYTELCGWCACVTWLTGGVGVGTTCRCTGKREKKRRQLSWRTALTPDPHVSERGRGKNDDGSMTASSWSLVQCFRRRSSPELVYAGGVVRRGA
jgi:hypothetical protein